MSTNIRKNGFTIFPVIEQLQPTIEKATCFVHPKQMSSEGSGQEDESPVPAISFWICVAEEKSLDFSVI